ncbi:MAG: TetR/AcrR family transcriptional regulator [Gordonia sp. (in: high G+C Gram-positive bacteria)]
MVRTYQSAVRSERAQENRARVVAAATESFCELGWVATTMADVGRRAGLTRQTVYQQFSGKLPLLDACIGTALSEGSPRPVRELADYRAMGDGDFDQRLAAGARWLRDAHRRSATIQDVLDQAAVTDPEAAELLAAREQRRWDEVRWAMSLVLQATPPDALVDSVWWAASRRGWLSLTRQRGWSEQAWEDWFVAQVRTDIERLT